MTPGQSLSALGLRIQDGLTCPEGGPHEISTQRLVVLAAQGGGTAACLKCRRTLTLAQA
jgi:hypothetical protein